MIFGEHHHQDIQLSNGWNSSTFRDDYLKFHNLLKRNLANSTNLHHGKLIYPIQKLLPSAPGRDGFEYAEE